MQCRIDHRAREPGLEFTGFAAPGMGIEVGVRTGVGVGEGVAVGDGVGEGVAVGEGVGVGSGPPHAASSEAMPHVGAKNRGRTPRLNG